MNKIAKGAIAGGIGVALLLGGAGTLAYWTASAPAGADATITAGNLALSAPTAGTWSVTNGTASSTIADIEDFRMVPGDELTYTTTLNVTAEGDNLEATVAAALGANAITGATSGAADTALAGRLTADATFTVNGDTNGTTVIEASATPVPVVVSATITWPFDEGTDSPAIDNPAKLGAVNFADFNVVVTQQQPA